MADPANTTSVLVTGASGFVGRYVVQELVRRGYKPVCLVRSAGQFLRRQPAGVQDRLAVVEGDLGKPSALRQAAKQAGAAIHLVGIIINRRLEGKTFRRIHVDGTKAVIEAVRAAGIRRYVHMSALGTRPNAASAYHRTKWDAEQEVGRSGLDWTVFRPSIIHGPDGEFMELLKACVCNLLPPFIPCFGPGTAKVQPVSVKDVAWCMVEAVSLPAAIGRTLPMGGPVAYSWRDLYETCRRLIPRARAWKPVVSVPVPLARLGAALAGPAMALPEGIWFLRAMRKFRFDGGQVTMAQEDSVCDPTVVESAFNIKLRSFEEELCEYGERIR